MADTSGPAGDVPADDAEPKGQVLDDSAPSRPWWRLRPIAVVAIVVLVLLGAWLAFPWVAAQRELGSHGEVAVRVDAMCTRIDLGVDGMQFTSLPYDRGNNDSEANAWVGKTPFPRAWKGQTVNGTLEVVAVRSKSDMDAVFHADDGTDVNLWGGDLSNRFSSLSCPIGA